MLELGAHLVHQPVQQIPGRYRHRRGHVDEVALDPGPGRPPGGRPQQFRPPRRGRRAGPDRQGGPAHERAEQSGDEDDGVDVRARVTDPQLDGGQVRGGTDVEVDHTRVADHPGCDQVRDDLVVFGRRAERSGDAGGRPPLPDQGAHARVAAVRALPVRGTRRHRQQRRQPQRDPRGHRDRELPVGDLDVHLRAADRLLPGEELVVGEHPLVARVPADLGRVPVDQGDGPRGRGTEPERFAGHHQFAPQLEQAAAQIGQIGARATVGLHHRRQQFGGETLLRDALEDRRSPRHEPSGGEIQDVELLLDADGRDARVAHERRRYDHPASRAAHGAGRRPLAGRPPGQPASGSAGYPVSCPRGWRWRRCCPGSPWSTGTGREPARRAWRPRPGRPARSRPRSRRRGRTRRRPGRSRPGR